MPLALNHTAAVAYRGQAVRAAAATTGRSAEPTGALLRYDPRDEPLEAAAGRAHAARGARGGGDRRPAVRGRRRERLAARCARSRSTTSHARPLDARAGFAGRRATTLTGVASRRALLRAGRPRLGRATSRPPSATTRGAGAGSGCRTCASRAAGSRRRGCATGASSCSAARSSGRAARRSREVELFDPRTRRWRALPDMRTPRHGLGGVALGNRVFAIEGGPHAGLRFSNAIEFLDVPAERRSCA